MQWSLWSKSCLNNLFNLLFKTPLPKQTHSEASIRFLYEVIAETESHMSLYYTIWQWQNILYTAATFATLAPTVFEDSDTMKKHAKTIFPATCSPVYLPLSCGWAAENTARKPLPAVLASDTICRSILLLVETRAPGLNVPQKRPSLCPLTWPLYTST